MKPAKPCYGWFYLDSRLTLWGWVIPGGRECGRTLLPGDCLPALADFTTEAR